jgi:hypothetical protein
MTLIDSVEYFYGLCSFLPYTPSSLPSPVSGEGYLCTNPTWSDLEHGSS